MPVAFRTIDQRIALAPQSRPSPARLLAALLAAVLAGAALVEGVQLARDTAPAPGRSPRISAPGHGSPPPTAGGEQASLRPAPVLQFLKLSPEDAYLKNAAIPDSKIADTPARPFYLSTAAPVDGGMSRHCLAQAVYYEAASESLEGQKAVAQVVLNRVRDRRFPKTVCDVVFEGSGLRTGCQFSFTCDGSLDRPPSPAPWLRAQAVADAALDGEVMKAIGHATHYHTVWVTPYWGAGLTKWGRLGAHIFYRWSGGGAPVAIGLHPDGPAVPHLLDKGAAGSPDLIEAAAPVVAAAEPAPAPASILPVAIASAPLVGWPFPAGPAAGASALAHPPGVADAPYKTVRPSGGLDGPHFAARDHR